MKLTTNIRVQNSNDSEDFCDYLSKIGNGEIDTNSEKIKLSFGKICNTTKILIEHVYSNIASNYLNKNWLKKRAILIKEEEEYQGRRGNQLSGRILKLSKSKWNTTA